MTRDEAMMRLFVDNVGGGCEVHAALVDGLASLGFVEYDKPKPPWHQPVVEAIRRYPGTQDVVPMNVVLALETAGLKVVKC